MRMLIGFEVKEFDEKKVQTALEKCTALCKGCEWELDKCLISQNECMVKTAIESLKGMLRIGAGVVRFKEIGRV